MNNLMIIIKQKNIGNSEELQTNPNPKIISAVETLRILAREYLQMPWHSDSIC